MSTKKSKTKAKTRGREQKRAPSRRAGSRNIDVATVRQQAINMIGAEAASMVWATIEEGRKGHYQAMKFLFELAGIFPAPATEENTGETKSYAEILCRQLELATEPPSEETVTEVCQNETAAEEHAVESGSGL